MSNVHVEVDENIAFVTLDRAPVNALAADTMREITQIFHQLNDDKRAHVIVLRASGEKVFCAGADIRDSERRYSQRDTMDDVASDVVDPGKVARDMFTAVFDAAAPVIASVHGTTLGAGLALVACADFIVASDNATFGLPEITVGVLGGGRFLQRIVGIPKMRRMFFTGEQITAAEMYRLGAVERVVGKDQLADATREIARVIATKSPIGLRLGKQSLNRAEHLSVLDGYRIEQDYTAKVSSFEDSREARNAWREKREPNWGWN